MNVVLRVPSNRTAISQDTILRITGKNINAPNGARPRNEQ